MIRPHPPLAHLADGDELRQAAALWYYGTRTIAAAFVVMGLVAWWAWGDKNDAVLCFLAASAVGVVGL